jgi:hypothetical protein
MQKTFYFLTLLEQKASNSYRKKEATEGEASVTLKLNIYTQQLGRVSYNIVVIK